MTTITDNMSLWIKDLPKRFTVRSEYFFSFKTLLRAAKDELVLKEHLSLLLTLFLLFSDCRVINKTRESW